MKNTNCFIWLAFVLALVSCKVEKDYQKAISKNNIETYESYLKK